MASVVSLGSGVAVSQVVVSSTVPKASASLGLRVDEVRCGGAAFAGPMKSDVTNYQASSRFGIFASLATMNEGVSDTIPRGDFGRREIVMGLIGVSLIAFGNGTDALAADAPAILSKYIKRKKLDPLETYVPTIILAQSQFQEVDGKLEGKAADFAGARSLLRNGPAASLRSDIRAVAQYAVESGTDGASPAVDQCLSALEDLDGLLFQASRSQGAPIEKMRQRLSTAVTAIDKLLATVPAAVLERGKAVAKAYREQ